MARGKYAKRSIHRANEAAVDHIDRLTDQLVTYKARVKELEQQAAMVPQLQARIAQLSKDETLLALIDDLKRVTTYLARERKRWKDGGARDEFVQVLRDLLLALRVDTTCDRVELIYRRYPRLMEFIDGGRAWQDNRYHHETLRKLSDEAATRIERATGLRGVPQWAPDKDLAAVMDDALDARLMDVSREELEELLDLPPRGV